MQLPCKGMQLAAGGGDEDDGGATASGELEGELADGTLGPGAGGDRPGVEEGGGEVVEPVVDPIAPNRMFEKVTDASGKLASRVSGSLPVDGQGPRSAPGAFDPSGQVESSHFMFTA